MPWKNILFSVVVLIIGLLVVIGILLPSVSGIDIQKALELKYQLGEETGEHEMPEGRHWGVFEKDSQGNTIGFWRPCPEDGGFMEGGEEQFIDYWECACPDETHAISCGTVIPTEGKYRDDGLNSMYIEDNACKYYTRDYLTKDGQKRGLEVFCADDDFYVSNLYVPPDYENELGNNVVWTTDPGYNCVGEQLIWCGTEADISLVGDDYRDDYIESIHPNNLNNPTGCVSITGDAEPTNGFGQIYKISSSCANSNFAWYTSYLTQFSLSGWKQACPGDSTMISCLSKTFLPTLADFSCITQLYPHVGGPLNRYECHVDTACSQITRYGRSVSVLCAFKLYQWSTWNAPPEDDATAGNFEGIQSQAVCGSGTPIACMTETDDIMDSGGNPRDWFNEDGVSYLDIVWNDPNGGECNVYGNDLSGTNQQRRRSGIFCTQDLRANFREVGPTSWLYCDASSGGTCDDALEHIENDGTGWTAVKFQSDECPADFSPIFCGFKTHVDDRSQPIDYRDDYIVGIDADDKKCYITLVDKLSTNGLKYLVQLHTICAPSDRVNIIRPSSFPSFNDKRGDNDNDIAKFNTPQCVGGGIVTQILTESQIQSGKNYKDDAITSLIPDRSLQTGILGIRDVDGSTQYATKQGIICLSGTPEEDIFL